MASARTLSTTELGATRYSQAASTNTWPIQVCITPRSTDSGQQTRYKLVIPEHADTRFLQSVHNDLRATTALPVGWHTYKVVRDEEEVYVGRIQVAPGEAPLGTTKLASELTGRTASSVTQMGDAVDGKARVRFVYAEETYAVREVVGVVDDVVIQLEREEGGEFVGEGMLDVGVKEARFRVVPREWTRPEIAGFTRLGWDDAAGERGVLVTWPLEIVDGSGGAPGNGRLGVVIVGIGILVAGLAFAIVVGGGGKGGMKTDTDMSIPEGKSDEATHVARDVLKHMQGLSK